MGPAPSRYKSGHKTTRYASRSRIAYHLLADGFHMHSAFTLLPRERNCFLLGSNARIFCMAYFAVQRRPPSRRNLITSI